MEFEFDENKSRANKAKHGIDFVEAQVLWEDDDRLDIPARISDETRIVFIGKIGSKVWAAVVTYRGENIRIISVRRARKSEVQLYEGSSF
jgi:uncharacterized DUF497 family protein